MCKSHTKKFYKAHENMGKLGFNPSAGFLLSMAQGSSCCQGCWWPLWGISVLQKDQGLGLMVGMLHGTGHGRLQAGWSFPGWMGPGPHFTLIQLCLEPSAISGHHFTPPDSHCCGGISMGTKAAQAPILNPFKLKPTKKITPKNDTVAIS